MTTTNNNSGGYDALLEELKQHNNQLKERKGEIIESASEEGDVDEVEKAKPSPKNTLVLTPLTEENLSEFIFDNSQRLLTTSIAAVNDLSELLSSGATAKEVEALAGLIKSTTAVLDTLNNINLENKKSKSAKEIKTMDIDAKKQLTQAKAGSNLNVLVATREEVMKMIKDTSNALAEGVKTGVIDADFTEKV